MLRSLFAKQPKDREASRIATPKRGIPYDPALITALTHQHRELVMLLVKASSAAEQCFYAEAIEALTQFKTKLDTHLQREDRELVPYLGHHLWGEGTDELLRDMHTNSARVQRMVRRFLDESLDNPLNADNLSGFVAGVERLCEDFSQATAQEEAAFYTLYMGPEAY
jgi:hypothetical protein